MSQSLVARTLFWVYCLTLLQRGWCSSEDQASSSNQNNSIFSVPAFFVVFREATEASVIMGVCLQFLDQLGKKDKKKDVWLGAGLGLLLAIIFGVIFIVIFYVADNNLFSGDAKAIFEGVLSWFASIIITILAVSMLKLHKSQKKWERKLKAQMERAELEGNNNKRSTMFWIPFIAVLREGIETVVFLAGVGAGYPAKAIPLPGLLGLVCGLFCGWAMFAAGSQCTIKVFTVCSMVILMFMAAGLAVYGSHEFQGVGMFGPEEGENINTMNEVVWNICDCCNHQDRGWDVFRALFGYTCSPTVFEVITYCVYWTLALTFLCWKMRTVCFASCKQPEEDEEEVNAKDAVYPQKEIDVEAHAPTSALRS